MLKRMQCGYRDENGNIYTKRNTKLLILYCFMNKVSLFVSALDAKCPYYLVLCVLSVHILYCFICKVSFLRRFCFMLLLFSAYETHLNIYMESVSKLASEPQLVTAHHLRASPHPGTRRKSRWPRSLAPARAMARLSQKYSTENANFVLRFWH